MLIIPLRILLSRLRCIRLPKSSKDSTIKAATYGGWAVSCMSYVFSGKSASIANFPMVTRKIDAQLSSRVSRPPFMSKDAAQLEHRIKAEDYEPIPSMYSASLSQLIASLLHKDVSNISSFRKRTITDALPHGFNGSLAQTAHAVQ
jgi:hypothetical protein